PSPVAASRSTTARLHFGQHDGPGIVKHGGAKLPCLGTGDRKSPSASRRCRGFAADDGGLGHLPDNCCCGQRIWPSTLRDLVPQSTPPTIGYGAPTPGAPLPTASLDHAWATERHSFGARSWHVGSNQAGSGHSLVLLRRSSGGLMRAAVDGARRQILKSP